MRRFLICQVLPTLWCLLPLAIAVLVVAAMPEKALRFYLARLQVSYLDWIILGLGGTFLLIQLIASRTALQWQEQDFDRRADSLLQRFYQAAEWFPLLGLLGTVAGILQTFAAVGSQEAVPQREIIRLYAPALTTTGSGLLMTFLNILPVWLVAVGRKVISWLAGS